MRIGQGYDAHALSGGLPLILGGVNIPWHSGLLGHSDADVLTHAVIDALLGAAALGDIGRLFPDTDARYKDVCSLRLLSLVSALLGGYEVLNIDSTVTAQEPKLAPYGREMCENIASSLGVRASQVNVKFTTEEGLGFTGAGLGIAASAVALLRERL
ncbi:MAG: 2-C-methyl-D-erythritol 2,4-cyclodiphosphate synthase [Oscillospiraceae bacterium]|jgi:2-C-methyl-D-erythritol 2,4-cyclodiphosphate synthase|nr:2-C-methyl-D-erythritol 2,4-cyclodiphosphate synthase [Oscillospiraceae bacterium]